nr:uncharacterized protein LOC126530267 [Dermacentor andersoni]
MFESVQWATSPVKYLGVPLDQYQEPAKYWEAENERTRECTHKWGGRDLSIFARATLCNLFLVAKVWYVLQALCMSRTSVQRLHRVFAVFIWGSSWERTSRTNLFLSAGKGGLGLAHLFLRQLVSRFMFLRDQKDAFLRTVMQIWFKEALPEYVVSSSPVKRVRVRGFLWEVVRAFQCLKVRFSAQNLADVRRKQLYKDLIDTMLPIPLYRSIYCVGSEGNVLKRVKKMSVRPSMKSFFFQLHTGTLPVKPWLQEKGIFVPWSTNCLICRKPETIDHMFLHCTDAVFRWDVLQRTLKKELPISPYGIRFLSVDSGDEVPWDMFMLISLHSIWKNRMAFRHADETILPVREYFIENVSYVRDVFKAQKEQPEWLPLKDALAKLKRF